MDFAVPVLLSLATFAYFLVLLEISDATREIARILEAGQVQKEE